MNEASWSWSETAASRSRSAATGAAPSSSTRSESMKDFHRSPICCVGEPFSAVADAAAHSSMIARTCCSAVSAMTAKAPQLDRSDGISSSASQRPFTWPKRSSWGRIEGSIPARASSRIVMAASLTPVAEADGAMHPGAGDHHADPLVEAERSGAGVGREVAPGGAVGPRIRKGVRQQRASQSEPPPVLAHRDLVDIARVLTEDQEAGADRVAVAIHHDPQVPRLEPGAAHGRGSEVLERPPLPLRPLQEGVLDHRPRRTPGGLALRGAD